MTRPAMFRPDSPSRVHADGGSHYSRPLNLRWCARCAADVPAAGGSFRGPLFICVKHAGSKLAALPVATPTPDPVPAARAPTAFDAAPRHPLDAWLRPGARP